MIRTEQTKLLATAFLGISAILAGVIVPTVNGTVADLSHIAWVALGVSLIAYAQVWLERL
jgi:fucose permease